MAGDRKYLWDICQRVAKTPFIGLVYCKYIFRVYCQRVSNILVKPLKDSCQLTRGNRFAIICRPTEDNLLRRNNKTSGSLIAKKGTTKSTEAKLPSKE
jgi:hypothetical protein